MNKKKSSTFEIAFKVFVSIGMLAVVGLVVLYFIEQNSGKTSYFTQHFSLAIILFVVGVIALFLPRVSNKSYSGENKGDNLMLVVGFLLIISAIFSIVYSFMSL